MRATIGNTVTTPRSIDPKYFEYLAGATANGLVVGAYHRANVGRAVNDAVNEANHFVDNAQIAAGDVLPVLDIEQTHGLSVQEMKDWVRAWVQRVFVLTGVRPMIYSSPNFWRTNMGDATWFAEHDYPLWIAHWGWPSPTSPRGTGAATAGRSGSGPRRARSRACQRSWIATGSTAASWCTGGSPRSPWRRRRAARSRGRGSMRRRHDHLCAALEPGHLDRPDGDARAGATLLRGPARALRRGRPSRVTSRRSAPDRPRPCSATRSRCGRRGAARAP